jgi:hypothetical protein
MGNPLLWSRFSFYDNFADDAAFRRLILDNFASLTVEAPCTHRQIVEKISEESHVRIPIESLAECLSETIFVRGRTVFGRPGDEFDHIAENYENMQWWLTEKGLNISITEPVHRRLAARLDALKELPPRKRGFAFEGFLDAMFAVFGLSPRKSFRLKGTQIDGSFELDASTYLVEAKWQKSPVRDRDLGAFARIVNRNASWARGLFVSYSGFSKVGLYEFEKGEKAIICLAGAELHDILANNLSLVEVLKTKARGAAETGRIHIPVRELFDIS